MAVTIDGVRYSWTQPACTTCYAGLHGGQEPVTVMAEPETCCMCGKVTTSGIYVRIDPRQVPHPRPENDE